MRILSVALSMLLIFFVGIASISASTGKAVSDKIVIEITGEKPWDSSPVTIPCDKPIRIIINVDSNRFKAIYVEIAPSSKVPKALPFVMRYMYNVSVTKDEKPPMILNASIKPSAPIRKISMLIPLHGVGEDVKNCSVNISFLLRCYSDSTVREWNARLFALGLSNVPEQLRTITIVTTSTRTVTQSMTITKIATTVSTKITTVTKTTTITSTIAKTSTFTTIAVSTVPYTKTFTTVLTKYATETRLRETSYRYVDLVVVGLLIVILLLCTLIFVKVSRKGSEYVVSMV